MEDRFVVLFRLPRSFGPVRVDALAILLVRAQKVADLHFRSDRLIDNPYLRS